MNMPTKTTPKTPTVWGVEFKASWLKTDGRKQKKHSVRTIFKYTLVLLLDNFISHMGKKMFYSWRTNTTNIIGLLYVKRQLF